MYRKLDLKKNINTINIRILFKSLKNVIFKFLIFEIKLLSSIPAPNKPEKKNWYS